VTGLKPVTRSKLISAEENDARRRSGIRETGAFEPVLAVNQGVQPFLNAVGLLRMVH
jgi:hypothetical protein